MKTVRVYAQNCWRIVSDKVEATVSELGGQLAPVRFHTRRGIVEPFSIAPWVQEKLGAHIPPMLRVLRGDFFCLPFGGNETPVRGERHPPHGEIANEPWQFESLERQGNQRVTLHLSLATKIRSGRVDKFIQLRKGETAIYSQHVISGMSGKMNLGHHAMLKFPETPGSGRISTSRILFGQVFPGEFEDPAHGGYSCLKPGAFFKRLDRVPARDGGAVAASRYPARRGFEDLLMVVHESRPDFAWTAVTFPHERYVWFALKDPRVLRSTVFWISNGGRRYAPWNGRHTGVLGLEDVTSYFHCGLAESCRPNPVSRQGYPTCLTFKPVTPFVVNYVMAVAQIPRRFDRVRTISRCAGGVELSSSAGARTYVPLDADFLYSPAQ